MRKSIFLILLSGLFVSILPSFAQEIPSIDPTIIEKTQQAKDKTGEIVQKTGEIVGKTEEIAKSTIELVEIAGDVAGEAKQISGGLGGGCLIATATFGSELAPQVQMLRELRDDSLLATSSGVSFMTGFNALYYSFSPGIADLERENPVFKEAVKLTITPLISSLSLLNYVEMDSEATVLGYGIGMILLNVGMYFVVPAILIYSIRKRI